MNNLTPGLWNNEQLLGLIKASKSRLRAEAEEMAHEHCYRRRRNGLDRYNSPAQDQAMWRCALGAACVRIFRREIGPLHRVIADITSLSMPRYLIGVDPTAKAESFTIIKTDDGLTPETRAVVDHMHACIRAYAEILQLQLDHVSGPPAAAKADYQP